jgi:hypothetical protein
MQKKVDIMDSTSKIVEFIIWLKFDHLITKKLDF